ncbi:MAG TPA: DUF721 domain-containing protein [Opitutaceae bacterium]|nr:DUF721 domain-containing protein [Opitutaceae bacterium]HQL22742.1 DUF721 domain-containing protein [Opitutaceae bacterium]
MPHRTQSFSKLAEELIGDFRGIPLAEPARMKRRPTRELKDLIEALLVKHHIGTHSPEDSIREKWAEFVGPANATYSHVANIDPRGRLIILASHSTVGSELGMYRETILAKIRQLPGCGHVRELRIRAG